MGIRDVPPVLLDRDDGSTTRQFWAKRSVEERLSAVEFLREQFYAIAGYPSLPRLVRKIRLISRRG